MSTKLRLKGVDLDYGSGVCWRKIPCSQCPTLRNSAMCGDTCGRFSYFLLLSMSASYWCQSKFLFLLFLVILLSPYIILLLFGFHLYVTLLYYLLQILIPIFYTNVANVMFSFVLCLICLKDTFFPFTSACQCSIYRVAFSNCPTQKSSKYGTGPPQQEKMTKYTGPTQDT